MEEFGFRNMLGRSLWQHTYRNMLRAGGFFGQKTLVVRAGNSEMGQGGGEGRKCTQGALPALVYTEDH